MPSVQHMRGTRAALNALATGSGLLPGQVYVLTDEARLAVALTTSTYETFARENEVPPAGSDGWSYQTLAADFNTTTTGGALVTGMSFAALANSVYEIELVGSFQTAATTTGAGAMLDVPAGATVTGLAFMPSANNGVVQASPQRASGAVISPTTAVGTAAAVYPVFGRWLVQVGATADDIALRWRSEIADSEARLRAGTIMKRRLAAGAAAIEPLTVLSFAAADQAGYDAAVAANSSNPLVLVVRHAEP